MPHEAAIVMCFSDQVFRVFRFDPNNPKPQTSKLQVLLLLVSCQSAQPAHEPDTKLGHHMQPLQVNLVCVYIIFSTFHPCLGPLHV